jgi:hypothetical protein
VTLHTPTSDFESNLIWKSLLRSKPPVGLLAAFYPHRLGNQEFDARKWPEKFTLAAYYA